MAKRKNGEIEFNFEGSEALQMPEENGEYAVAEDTTATDGGVATEDTYEEPSSEAAEDNNIHNNNEEEASMEENNSTMITETTAADGSNEYKFQVNDDGKAVKSAIERAIKDEEQAGVVNNGNSYMVNNGLSLGFTIENLKEQFEKMRRKVALYASDDALKKMAPSFTTESAMRELWLKGYIAVEEEDAQSWFDATFQTNFLGYAAQDALNIAKDVEWVVNNYGLSFYPSLTSIVGKTMIDKISQYDVVEDKEAIIQSIEEQISTKETKLPDRIKWEAGKIWLVLLTEKEIEDVKKDSEPLKQLTDSRKWLITRFNNRIKEAAIENGEVTGPNTTEPAAENGYEQPTEEGSETVEIQAEAWNS